MLNNGALSLTPSVDACYDKHTITGVGGISHSTSQNKFGGSSIVFDGSNDQLQSDHATDFDLGTEFTWESWVYHSSLSGEQYYFTNDVGGIIGVRKEIGGNVRFLSNGTAWQDSGWNPSTGTWYHIALVGTGGNATKFYVDGVQKGSTLSATFSGANVGGFTCGSQARDNMQYLNGYMDEFRISNTARYTSGFTPSTTAFECDSDTVLLIHSDTTNGSTTFVGNGHI